MLKNDPRLQQQQEKRPARRGTTSESRIECGEPAMRKSLRSQYSSPELDRDESTR